MKNNEIHKTVQSDFLKNVSEILLQARKNANLLMLELKAFVIKDMWWMMPSLLVTMPNLKT